MDDERSSAMVRDPAIVLAEEFEKDPHAVFSHYRPLTPFITGSDGIPLVLRANDVRQLVTDHRLRQSETEFPAIYGITEGALFDLFKYTMLFSNGADHRRRRSPFTATFALRFISDLRPHIRKVAEELIDSWQAAGEIDFLDCYASQMPALIISEILGLPSADIPRFTSLVYNVSRIFSPLFTANDIPDMQTDARQLFDYVDQLLGARRASPKDDFLTAFLAAVDESDDLSPIEIILQIVILIMGGSDTTRGALAIQTALLLQHRDQWDAVCRDPALIPGAVLESLRFEPIVAGIGRVTIQDIELDGCVLEAGRFIVLSSMSAMRDAELYQNPDTFNIRRTDQQRWSLAFGGGAHRCIGEALAKAELEEGLAALAARLPQLRLAGKPPEIRGHHGLRRIDGMRVTWPISASG